MKLKELAAAATINVVYWIDDQFSEGGLQLAQRLRAKISSLNEYSIKPDHPALESLAFSGIEEKDLEIVIGLIIGKPQLGREILQSLDRQIAGDSPGDDAIKDLSELQIASIGKCFTDVRKLCFKDWQTQKDQILEQDNSNALFLIDHDFSLEDGCSNTTGEDILKTIFASSSKRSLCILFTHGTARGKEHVTRKKIVQAIASPSRQHFSVVCKEHITLPEGGDDVPLAEAFQDAFIREWCDSLVETVQNVFIQSFQATNADIMDLAFEEISASFFRRSVSDGVSEFDVLVRVMMLAGRVAVEDSRPKQLDLWAKLAKIRTLMGVGSSRTQRTISLEGNLVKLRQREIWDTAETVNSMFSYPSCGDVFEFTEAKKNQTSHYVLVSQPCHLAIRSDGYRKNNEGLFLALSKKAGEHGRCYEFDFPMPPLGRQWINFDKVFPVNLHLLDLASFNAEGELSMRKDASPVGLYLPGVRKHFDKMHGYVKSYKKENGPLSTKYRRFSLSSDCYDKETEIAGDGKLVLPFKRVGRIRSPHSEAILGAFAVYHTRMAFDYDFSKEESREESPKKSESKEIEHRA